MEADIVLGGNLAKSLDVVDDSMGEGGSGANDLERKRGKKKKR